MRGLLFGIARASPLDLRQASDKRFLINSLAHYIGEQYYTTEVTARGNLLLALLTNGIHLFMLWALMMIR